MNRAWSWAAALLILAVGSAGCSEPGRADGKQAPKEGGRPPVAVEVARAAAADITQGVDVVGTLAAKFQADVKSEVTGSIAEVYVTEWVRVRKGAPLARVDTREAESVSQKAEAAVEVARASLLEAQAAGSRADREYERARKLKEAGLVTQQALEDALTQKEAAAARVVAAKAQIHAAEEDVRHAKTRTGKAVIRSPFDGVVAERYVNVGEVVGEMQKVVFRVVDNRLLDLTVNVPSSEMGALRVGQSLTFETDAIPGKTFTGKVKFLNPIVSEADRSVKVVAEVLNEPEVLKGGLFVKGRILTGKRSGVLQVPRTALLSWDVAARKADVLVVKGDVARRQTLQTGIVSGDFVEVSGGLSAGEEVVTRGGFNVKDGDKVNIGRVGGDR